MYDAWTGRLRWTHRFSKLAADSNLKLAFSLDGTRLFAVADLPSPGATQVLEVATGKVILDASPPLCVADR